jgi:hypothetical protein
MLSPMESRRGRLILFILLLLVGVGTGLITWDVARRIVTLETAGQDLDTRLERMMAAAGDIVAAQQAYVAPGQPDDAWAGRVASLIEQFQSDVEAVRTHVRSIEAAGALQAVTDAVRDLGQLDLQVREHLRFGEELIAADLIFSDGRSATDAVAKELRGIRDAERAVFGTGQEELLRQMWTTHLRAPFVLRSISRQPRWCARRCRG